MARIVGGIGTSHTPTIGFALDANKQTDPVWAPIFAGYQPVQQWLREKQPDVLFFIYNDHVTSFFFDHYSHFALGVGEEYAVADEGGGAAQAAAGQGPPRPRPPHRHGAQRRLSLIFRTSRRSRSTMAASRPCRCCGRTRSAGRAPSCRCRSGVLEFPIPTARRCFRLGQVAAPGDRELSGGYQGGHRRHRRPVAPGARRARRIQQHALGHGVPRAAREGARAADRADDRAVRRARRAGRRGSDHVADHARRACPRR